MKILVVSSYLPFPLVDGGKVRLYNILKNLSENHEITLVCEKRSNQNQKDIDSVSKICKKVIVINRPKAWSVSNVAKSIFTLNPFLTTTHSNREMKEIISKEIKQDKYDLIHVETFYVMQNVPSTKLPIVLVEHNIEYEVYEKYASKSSIFIRPGLKFDIFKLKRKEKEAWKKANKVIAVSPKEQKKIGPKTEIVPNGVDLNKFKFVKKNLSKSNKKILFIGNFSWIQNRDSASFIIRNIWPKIVSKNPNYKLWIVGKKIPDSIKNLSDWSIIFDEDAPSETELIFQEADLLLSPIRVGGGSNFKILEAMAVGTPVITSSLGNEGLGASEGSEILIAEKPEEYAKISNQILNDNYLYEKITRNGRIFVEKNFDWIKISKKLEDIYKETIKL